jgi:hypothetical protein
MASGIILEYGEQFIVICMLLALAGFIYDNCVQIANALGLPQDALNTLTWFGYILMALGFIWLVTLIYNLIVTMQNQSSGRY